ncbi:MAG: hypothetical protein A2X34_08740 [Elusimicrobia bacterium GWC2_51_8]|nr:MAG: hypothetical protein A2X34_08740 [Elusimicrobia bacterium GWC2_51_8]
MPRTFKAALSCREDGLKLPEAPSDPAFPYAPESLNGIDPADGRVSFSRENAIFFRVKLVHSLSSVKTAFIPAPEMRPIRKPSGAAGGIFPCAARLAPGCRDARGVKVPCRSRESRSTPFLRTTSAACSRCSFWL